LVVYIILSEMHGHTNIKFILRLAKFYSFKENLAKHEKIRIYRIMQEP